MIERKPGADLTPCQWCLNPLEYFTKHPVCWAHMREYKEKIERLTSQLRACEEFIENYGLSDIDDIRLEAKELLKALRK